MRFYFYEIDENGRRFEMDTPHNGMISLGTDRMAKDASGRYIPDTVLRVEGKSHGKHLWIGPADFPGKRVIVKHWMPPEHDMQTDYRELRDDAAAE